jgi:hypothetical protein
VKRKNPKYTHYELILVLVINEKIWNNGVNNDSATAEGSTRENADPVSLGRPQIIPRMAGQLTAL